ncbi:MAG: EAL domain-containing response regulator [Proteobacteria bacterium]|nr:EAL domain-containing response regulator [Pseudomonadota bacterium]
MLPADLTYLVVEDNDFQRRWLTVMLANLGATKIIEAHDGLTALQILEDPTRGIDLCFIDLKLPGMDGMELIRHMARSDNPVSIILASALDPSLVFSVESMSHAYGVNLLGTVEKPVTPERLAELIGRHVPPHERGSKHATHHPALTLDDITAGMRADQFLPYFQPKVEIATGKIKGVEAFARWQHPQYGLISPNSFIPQLEAGGDIQHFTWSIIDKSVATCRWLQDQERPLPVSINISTTPLTELTFAERLAECTTRHKVAPEHMIIEITESASTTEIPTYLENLARLRMQGFVLAVDDYGTGNASMHHHLRIPFSELKIDRSFVAGAGQNTAVSLALRSSLDLARELKRESTAVGVETREDWELLHKLGCTNAQGYFIAKPMEGAALPAWMDEWSQFF